MFAFTSGLITAGFVIASLFFLRFWTKTKETLFLSFAAAFALLALCQGLLVFAGLQVEEQSWLYLLRFAAFVCIILGIWQNNLRRSDL